MLRCPLRKDIESKDITFKEATEILGISEMTLYSWLSGRRFPNNVNFKKIAEFMERDEVELLEEWQTWREEKKQAIEEWEEWKEKHPPISKED